METSLGEIQLFPLFVTLCLATCVTGQGVAEAPEQLNPSISPSLAPMQADEPSPEASFPDAAVRFLIHSN